MSIEIATLLSPLAGAAVFAYFTVNYTHVYENIDQKQQDAKREAGKKRQLYLTLTFLCLLIAGTISYHQSYGVSTNSAIIQIVSSVFFYLMGFLLLVDIFDFVIWFLFEAGGALSKI